MRHQCRRQVVNLRIKSSSISEESPLAVYHAIMCLRHDHSKFVEARQTPCPQVESNHHLSFRRALLYPLEL